ncbi:phosphatidylglycerophosphatase A [Sporosarcina sp. P16a]|uniref:phosphatidylglycerophosphatase A family protein n=1 Tax=Sporosarcina TaxID=1569 RepID=UPI000A15A206|nr:MULTISPECIES: phosphatidylglycerophosphatase A [Sporosarcina]ARJ39869.1 phosphatidylglycerophosphatase A [Sporosarcina ureae]PIC66557.1 phosphatidylglycerophosphatase A [Sporosarcina sp. P16a]PIC81996.1 phosphatidylglycerophosphatase A [Sporosarcina sp. P1]PIC93146.1 phosphatidylglycerophosphatase A [Sporosarcina sp. P25]
MDEGKNIVHSDVVTAATKDALIRRGVKIEDIAKIVYELQVPYNKGLSLEQCIDSVESVLRKRELQHAILVGVELDEIAERGQLSQPLQQIVESDEGLFGVDETIALGAVYTYGSIAVTTFGHLDKNKVGIINELDTKKGIGIHTFLDDLVASVAACAASRIAHRTRDLKEAGLTFKDVQNGKRS